ncbi:MAG: hypothetical protein K0S11_497 [Gammaproteobacteria bacterium]|jgi:hypothetical protein|nr:hypothetical protein [Gammaproteobacteria bacterium]
MHLIHKGQSQYASVHRNTRAPNQRTCAKFLNTPVKILARRILQRDLLMRLDYRAEPGNPVSLNSF